MKPCTDKELRNMRDAVYPQIPGFPQTDERWLMVRDAWRKDEVWLTDQYKNLKVFRTNSFRL